MCNRVYGKHQWGQRSAEEYGNNCGQLYGNRDRDVRQHDGPRYGIRHCAIGEISDHVPLLAKGKPSPNQIDERTDRKFGATQNGWPSEHEVQHNANGADRPRQPCEPSGFDLGDGDSFAIQNIDRS